MKDFKWIRFLLRKAKDRHVASEKFTDEATSAILIHQAVGMGTKKTSGI